MEYRSNNYNLDNSESQFYVFEIKLKCTNNKYTIRRIKQTKYGQIVDLIDNIKSIESIKISVFDINDPNNILTIKKKDLPYIDNIIIKNHNLLLQVNNSDMLTINYRFV
jgi:cyclophilin family peptidyl-prolyl cis-trans isomerase